jgi:pimeloyl-ACP methyl ester carboxylesterase
MLAIPDDLPAMEARYSTLQIPVSVLFGRQDQILDYRRHGEQLVHKLPRSRLTLVDGGHMLPVTAPEITTEWLLNLTNGAAPAFVGD